ncbi:MAG: hypothetical protein KA327_08445, partial [Pseudarcicella sp.]|nr:hypothetical protein [Pseudarcicella sp.]
MYRSSSASPACASAPISSDITIKAPYVPKNFTNPVAICGAATSHDIDIIFKADNLTTYKWEKPSDIDITGETNPFTSLTTDGSYTYNFYFTKNECKSTLPYVYTVNKISTIPTPTSIEIVPPSCSSSNTTITLRAEGCTQGTNVIWGNATAKLENNIGNTIATVNTPIAGQTTTVTAKCSAGSCTSEQAFLKVIENEDANLKLSIEGVKKIASGDKLRLIAIGLPPNATYSWKFKSTKIPEEPESNLTIDPTSNELEVIYVENTGTYTVTASIPNCTAQFTKSHLVTVVPPFECNPLIKVANANSGNELEPYNDNIFQLEKSTTSDINKYNLTLDPATENYTNFKTITWELPDGNLSAVFDLTQSTDIKLQTSKSGEYKLNITDTEGKQCSATITLKGFSCKSA